jgi:poly(hydroxyalkanoate) depolymerase family esterase
VAGERRWGAALVALIIGALAAVVIPTEARPESAGRFTQHIDQSPGARDHWLFVPTKVAAKPALVVFLHGCTQTAVEGAQLSRFNDLVAREGFVVAYPEQRVTPNSSAPAADGNGTACWNWFLPEHQGREAGEPAAIAAITRKVAGAHDVDRDRIYVIGISAGADMATIMAATYPDLFAAGSALAGCAYRTCGDTAGQLAY